MTVDVDIAHVARLARLALGPEDLDRLRMELAVILEHAATIQSIDTDGVVPTAHPLGIVNRFRPDEARLSLDRAEVLSQAPDVDGDHFRVPPALEQA